MLICSRVCACIHAGFLRLVDRKNFKHPQVQLDTSVTCLYVADVQIWDLADPGGKGYLDKHAFFIALKLIALVQNGKEANMAIIGLPVSLPNMVCWAVQFLINYLIFSKKLVGINTSFGHSHNLKTANIR